MVTGKLGLLLAVPPGYATIIWPASGIAIGMLLVHGARLWPAILLGSWLLNAYQSGVFAEGDWLSAKAFAALCIALGSTAQALAGRVLVARLIGVPLRLKSARDVLLLLLLTGPVTCIIAASVGVGTLFALGIIGGEAIVGNWLAWWSGDSLGVLVFTPLVLLAPGGRAQITWRGEAIGQLPFAALLLLALPLGLTFYAWQVISENDYLRGDAKFETLSIAGEKALENRLASYGNALLGAASFIQGSSAVSRREWRTYAESIRMRENFPGLNGLGWVEAGRHRRHSRIPAQAPRGRRTGLQRSIRASTASLTTSSATWNPKTRIAPRSASTSPSNAIGWRPPTWRATRVARPSPGWCCWCRTTTVLRPS